MDERMSEWLMNAMKWKEMKGNEKNNMKGIKRKEMKRIKGMKWISWPGQWTNARTNAWPLQMNFSSQRYFFSHHSLPSFFHSDFFPRYFLWASSSLSYHFSEHRGTIGPKATPTSKSGVQPSCLIFLAVGNGRARKRSNTNPPLATPEPQDLWNHIVSGTSLLSPDHCTDTMFCTLADYSWLVLCMMAASLRLVKKQILVVKSQFCTFKALLILVPKSSSELGWTSCLVGPAGGPSCTARLAREVAWHLWLSCEHLSWRCGIWRTRSARLKK